MSEKVKVSKEVAEAIESAKSVYSEESIVNIAIKKSFVAEKEPLNNINPYIIVKMLLHGYEIEQTPEEIWDKRKEEARNNISSHAYHEGFYEAITWAEDNFQIKGVNC